MSKIYEALLKYPDIYKACLDNHYNWNEYPPEHYFTNDELLNIQPDQIPPLARMELTCELLGSVLGVYRKNGNLTATIADCIAIIEKESWDHWKFAVKECLPEASTNPPIPPQRWPEWMFYPGEIQTLVKLYEKFKAIDDDERDATSQINEILRNLLQMGSVSYYMTDLYYHREAVKEVFNTIPVFKNNMDLQEKILEHDKDKYEIEMIIGYVLNVEMVKYYRKTLNIPQTQ